MKDGSQEPEAATPAAPAVAAQVAAPAATADKTTVDVEAKPKA